MRTPAFRRLAAGLSSGVIAIALTACGSGSTENASSTSGTTSSGSASDVTATTVSVTEADFSITLSSHSLPAGTYTFEVQNTGSATHALEIEGPGLDDAVSGKIQGGESTTLTVPLQPGEYEVYCPIGDHRAMGMDTTLTVT